MSRSEALLIALVELASAYVLAVQFTGLLNVVIGRPAISKPLLFGIVAVVAAIFAASVLLSGFPLRKHRLGNGFHGLRSFRIPAAILGLTYLLFLADAATSFPTGYDAISYHLCIPTAWLQTASFQLPETWWKMALPANGELFTLPFLALNAQNLVFAGNVLATGILGLSAYRIARHFSASPEAAAFACLVVLGMPLVVFQTFVLNVDAFGTAFVFAALALLFVFSESGRTFHVVLCGFSAGVAMGTKHVFIAYAGLVLVAAVALLGKRRRFVAIAALLLAAAAPSSLWIARNWINTGNPVYPFAVHLAGVSLRNAREFPPFQVKPSATGPIGRRKFNGSPFTEDRGLGPVFGIFAPAAMLASLWLAWRRRAAALAVFTATLVALSAVWWTSMHVVRFGLPLFAGMGILCAVLCRALVPRHQAIARGLMTAGMAVGCLVSLSVPAQRVVGRIRLHDWSRAAFYGYPALLDHLPPGSRVLDRSSDDHFGFLLLGSGLSNRVYHLDLPLTDLTLGQLRSDYVVTQGDISPEDDYLAARGEVVYRGVPGNIFPKTARSWRVYHIQY